MTARECVEARERCLKYRKRILQLSQKLGALHIAPAFSCLEMVDVLYNNIMGRRDGSRVEFVDSFILSKGHGALAQYTVLEGLGVLPRSELDNFCTPTGRLGGHPDYGTPGIEASTGSLGHGLPMALGMALADKVMGVDRVVYVMMSDGELNEGSVWEAVLLAPTLGLTNIVTLIDLNDFQSLGRISESHPNFYPVREKLESFGWDVAEVNGHDPAAIFDSMMGRSDKRPLSVIGRTVKGKGVSYMENAAIWHYRAPSKEEYEIAMAELDGGPAQ